VFLTTYYSSDHTKKNEMGRACGTYGREQRCIEGSGGKPEGKRPLERHGRRWKDNSEIDYKVLSTHRQHKCLKCVGKT
jgi:hypothetical protein